MQKSLSFLLQISHISDDLNIGLLKLLNETIKP